MTPTDEFFGATSAELLALTRSTPPDRDRTGTGRWTLPGVHFKCPAGVAPVLGLKSTPWRTAIREMEWMLSGSTNIHDAHPSVERWWRPWARPDGSLGASYGAQFHHGDQLRRFLDRLRDDPSSRRHVMSLYPREVVDVALPPCHGTVIQAVIVHGVLHLVCHQRSADFLVGLPCNLVQYKALQLWFAAYAGCEAGSFTYQVGDLHVYDLPDHLACLDEVQRRWSNLAFQILYGGVPELPVLTYTTPEEEPPFRADLFSLTTYNPMPTISLSVAV